MPSFVALLDQVEAEAAQREAYPLREKVEQLTRGMDRGRNPSDDDSSHGAAWVKGDALAPAHARLNKDLDPRGRYDEWWRPRSV